MKGIPKKVRRVLSADESLQRYFHYLEKRMNARAFQRWKLAQVYEVNRENVRVLKQVVRVLETGEGIYIEVR